MAVSPAMIKAGVALATDKRTWIFIGSVICGVLAMIVAVVAAFLNIFSFDDTASSVASAAYISFINEMKACYVKLDAQADSKCSALDKDQIHAVFYTIYFGEDKTMPDGFYDAFVECFVTRTVDADGNEIVSPCDTDTALSRLEGVTGKDLSGVTGQQIAELASALRYGVMNAGEDGGTYSGPAREAYSDATFATLMNEATRYIGYPYVWGGSSPSTSFDCSGFVCWVYTQSGVHNLPRTTAQGIFNQCTRISREEVKPGDLIFFTRTYVSSEPVTHVGIYVGEGQMLHCGNPIKYASINTDYWTSHFYAFGRLT